MHENEVLVFLFASVVLIFVAFYRQQLTALPAPRWLFASYFAVWCAWLATNLEHIVLPQLFNFVEHLGYAINGLLLLAWCWLTMRRGVMNDHD